MDGRIEQMADFNNDTWRKVEQFPDLNDIDFKLHFAGYEEQLATLHRHAKEVDSKTELFTSIVNSMSTMITDHLDSRPARAPQQTDVPTRTSAWSMSNSPTDQKHMASDPSYPLGGSLGETR